MDLLAQWQSIANWFTAANLPWLLLIGSGVLVIALLWLALTQWGHARPVWKCVLLSVVAHILLMGYAYGTRLIWQDPASAQAPADLKAEEFQVSLLDEAIDLETMSPEEVEASESLMSQAIQAPPINAAELPGLARPRFGEFADGGVDSPPNPLAKPAQRAETIGPLPQPMGGMPPGQQIAERQQSNFPDARAIPPEPIEIHRRKADSVAATDVPADTLSELDRPDLKLDRPNFQSAPADQGGAPSVTDQLVASQLLPQPVMAPSIEERLEMKRLPRPVKNQLRVTASSRRLGDGQPMPSVYSLRSRDNRLAVAQKRGGSLETEQAVEEALKWLAARQQPDGRWDPRATQAGREDRILGHNRDGAGAQADTGITALATLAFLAAGHTHLEGEHRGVVYRALQYLIQQQSPSGDLSGQAKLFAKMYCHSMALLAISESLAITGDHRLRPAVQRGVEFSQAAQNRTDGGWRYQPGDSGDMSQFGWQVLALHSAKLGGVDVDDATMARMERFLDSCTSGAGKGLASYRPNQGPTTTMTAEALLCRFVLQPSVNPVTVSEAQRQIVRELPNRQHVNLYYWYYGTLAMYHAGGRDWKRWNEELKSTLLGLQIRDGSEAGSWPANGMWGGYGGTVYSTAMATLNLEVYYRYLPLYQQLAQNPDTSDIR